MAKYLIVYSTGKSLIDGEKFFIRTKKKKEFVEAVEAIKGLGYTIIHQSHDERKIKL